MYKVCTDEILISAYQSIGLKLCTDFVSTECILLQIYIDFIRQIGHDGLGNLYRRYLVSVILVITA
jgi:hypothetical protein